MTQHKKWIFISLMLAAAFFAWGVVPGQALTPSSPVQMKRITPADRQAAADNAQAAREAAVAVGTPAAPAPSPGQVPDYFGIYPNYANSPLPILVKVTITEDGTGSGSGATAVATVNPSNGSITAIDVVNGGSGYGHAKVTIEGNIQGTTPPPPRPPRAARTAATATVASDQATAVDKVIGGADNTSASIISEDSAATKPPRPGSGSSRAATATATIVNGTITAITVTNPGSGYTKPFAGTGIRKFVDAFQQLQIAAPDTTTFPGSDYYEIEMGQYTHQMHSDLPPTTLRGYRQTNVATPQFSYLGPVILANRDRPVRIKFTNKLPLTGEPGGDLFIPVDTTYMGAGLGPDGITNYTENRSSTHLHGGATPWISDGTPHQWITPVGETTLLRKRCQPAKCTRHVV